MIKHTVEFRARYAETDQMRFVHHSVYAVWFEFARVELLKAYGFSYARMEQEGYLLPLIELNVKFIRAARFDDLVRVTAFIKEVPGAKILLNYEVHDDNQVLLAEGSTLHTFMNHKQRAIKPPKTFINELSKYF